jgi:hypothetical protein
MTSFIDLMANDVWSDADITRRTEAMIRTEFSAEAETILNRKALGLAMGNYEPSMQDLMDMARYNSVAMAAQAAGIAARADMALLLQALALEEAQARLDADPTDAAAQAVLDGASQEARDLFDLRRTARTQQEGATDEN